MSQSSSLAICAVTAILGVAIGCGGGSTGGGASSTPAGISVTPNPAIVLLGGTEQFLAHSSAGPSVSGATWSVSGAGTISSTGIYTAPADLPASTVATITASAPTTPPETATATLTIESGVTGVTLASSPAGAATAPPGASVALVATLALTQAVDMAPDTSLLWAVNGTANGSATWGTIAPGAGGAAVYTAPATAPSPADVTITATSAADASKSASLALTIAAPPTVVVSPASPQVLLGNTQQFTAAVAGSANTAVNWTVTGGGTISASGLYTAPADLPAAATVTVTATSQADLAATGTATATITSDVAVTLATVPAGGGALAAAKVMNLAATITSAGQPDQALGWAVDGIANGSAAFGTITPGTNGTAVYTAPVTPPGPPLVTITATSVADAAKSAALSLSISTVGPPVLAQSVFFGGPGDQRGAGIAYSGGTLYLTGDTEPQSQDATGTAELLAYAAPLGSAPAPTWSKTITSGTNFYGVTATSEGVYATGWNYSLTSDAVGTKEVKTDIAKFALDGSAGAGNQGSAWTTGGPGTLGPFFAYSGVEIFSAAGSQTEGGTPYIYGVGGGQPCSDSAYLVAKYDTAGNYLGAATDSSVGITFGNCSVPSGGGSAANAVAFLNGNVYLAGDSSWTLEDSAERPAIWKYDSGLGLQWRAKDTTLAGAFYGVTFFKDAIYAVGDTYTAPYVAGGYDYLIEKFDESGNLVWRKTAGGAGDDQLTAIVPVGGELYAVGTTRSQGSGGADIVILSLDPSTGNILSTTLWGGAGDDIADGAATDGGNLYIVGQSKSYAAADGNVVGSDDGVLLQYGIPWIAVSPGTAQVQPGSTQQFTASIINIDNTAVTWSVTGEGSISASGLYTAPASLPPSTVVTVTVTATSQADPTASASATVTVVSPSAAALAKSSTGRH